MLFNRYILVICVFFSLTVFTSLVQPESNDKELFYLTKIRHYLFQNSDSTQIFLLKASEAYSGDKTDSLFAELLLLKGIHNSIKGSVNEALNCFTDSYYIYKKLNIKRGLAECLINIGEIHYNWGQYDKAFLYFTEGKELANEYGLAGLEIKAINFIGKFHHSKGNFQLSIQFYKRALALANETKDTIGIIALNNKIGKHYKTMGDYAKSLECFLKSEELIHSINNKIEIATTYNHLGNIYQELKDYPKAINFHKLALKTREEMDYKEGVGKSLKNLGEVYIDINQLDSALICFEQSYDLCKEVGYAKGLIKNIFNQGVIYKMQGKDALAINKFNKSLNICKQIGYAIGEIKALSELAEVYKNQHKYNLALETTGEGLEIAIEEDMKASIADFYLVLYKIYLSKNEYKKALLYYTKHTEVNDEILNLESKQKIAELQTEYKVSLQNRENEVLKKENQINELMIKRKNLYIFFAIIILSLLSLVVVVMYFLFLQKKKANLELTILNNNILAKNEELDRLNKKLHRSKKQQVKLFSIISHELRNPLYWFRNLIQMLTLRIDSIDKEMITKSLNSLNESATNTFHLMDNLLHWSRSQLGNIKYSPEPVDISTLIKENVELISHYAAYKNISIEYNQVQGLMVRADKVMVQTVIRNLLSNAVKFTPAKGDIVIFLKEQDEFAYIKVKDTGVGMDKRTLQSILSSSGTSYIPSSDKETGSGLGLALTKEFIELNGGNLIAKSKEGKGSVFSFKLPLVHQLSDSLV